MITRNDKYPVEQSFEINANTRSIAVPSDFAKNGVGVIGDNMAEALEFTIDRYFDDIDLGLDSTISVRWVNPDNKGGIDKVDEAWIDRTNPDELKFTWVLREEVLGNKAGNIKFNIGIEIKNRKIRFNTQPQNISTKAGLVLPGDIIEEDLSDVWAMRKGLGGNLAKLATITKDLPEEADVGKLSVEVDKAALVDCFLKADWYKDGAHITDAKELDFNALEPGKYQVVLTTSKKLPDEEAYDILSEKMVEFKYHPSIASVNSTVCFIAPAQIIEFIRNYADQHIGAAEGTDIEFQIVKPEKGNVIVNFYKVGAEEPFKSNVEVTGDVVTLHVTEDGIYTAELIHSLNNSQEKTQAGVCEVILEPLKPKATIKYSDKKNLVGETILEAVVSNLDKLNNVTYQWYFADSQKEVDENAWKLIKNGTQATYQPLAILDGGEGSGFYRVIVSNTKKVAKENHTVDADPVNSKMISAPVEESEEITE